MIPPRQLPKIAAPRASLEVQCSHAAARKALFGDIIPVTVGRYRVTGRMGLGGMGIVYAARDPDLRRSVAIKVVQPGRLRADPEAGKAQLLAEARSLARVSSPHVVTVLDVGLHGQEVYLAMELAEGPTLDVWLDQDERTMAEILEVFVTAGRGLVDAHALGVVHGDFKPANVIVTTGLQQVATRLIDFGLASLDRAGPSGGAGTPAYMAPEVRHGSRATAASDQYSFCVAFREALQGRRRSRRLQRALARGLATAPEARWPSMQALLDVVSATRAGGTAMGWAGLASITVVLGGLFVVGEMDSSRSGSCGPDPSAQVWSPSDAVAQGLPRAMREHVDAHVTAWSSAWEQACQLPTDQARMCLDEQLVRLSALLEVSPARMDTPTWSMAVASLDPPRRCLDEMTVGGGPADARTAVQWADAIVAADSDPEAGEAEALAALERARSFDPARQADATLVLGRLWAKQGRFDDAATAYERAALLGQRWHRDRTTAEAFCERVALELEVRGDYPAATDWIRHAEAAVGRANRPPDLDARLERLTGVLALKTGEHEEANERFTRSLHTLAQWYGDDHVALAAVHHDLGSNYAELRQLEPARTHFEWARQRWERQFGDRHPLVAMAWSSLGAVAEYGGNYEAALEAYGEALEVLEARPGDPGLPVAAFNLGNVLYRVGRYDEARFRYEQANERWVELNPEHPNLGHVQLGLGNIARDETRWDAATTHFDAAIDAWRRALGHDHMLVAMALGSSAEARLALGDSERAEASLRESIQIRERLRGPDDVSIAYPLTTLGNLLRRAQRFDEADTALGRALKLRQAQPNIDPRLLAETRFALAKLRRAQGQHDDARTLALAARADFDGPWPYAPDDVAMVQRWLSRGASPKNR